MVPIKFKETISLKTANKESVEVGLLQNKKRYQKLVLN